MCAHGVGRTDLVECARVTLADLTEGVVSRAAAAPPRAREKHVARAVRHLQVHAWAQIVRVELQNISQFVLRL